MVASQNKKLSKKEIQEDVWNNNDWNVVFGCLRPKTPVPGRPSKQHLFKVVAEKLPYEALREVEKLLIAKKVETNGVYMAHDSFGVARYGGRGQIFKRLASHKKKYPKELLYFSFYVIEKKSHERELENAILRAAGSQMILNTRKVREGIDPGSVADYEAGALFFERQKKRGRPPKKRQARRKSTSTAV